MQGGLKLRLCIQRKALSQGEDYVGGRKGREGNVQRPREKRN